jgi:hypothetical protein
MADPVNVKQIAFGRKADAAVAGAKAELVVSALKLLDVALAARQITGERVEHPYCGGAVERADVGTGAIRPGRAPQHQREWLEGLGFNGKSSGFRPNSASTS